MKLAMVGYRTSLQNGFVALGTHRTTFVGNTTVPCSDSVELSLISLNVVLSSGFKHFRNKLLNIENNDKIDIVELYV